MLLVVSLRIKSKTLRHLDLCFSFYVVEFLPYSRNSRVDFRVLRLLQSVLLINETVLLTLKSGGSKNDRGLYFHLLSAQILLTLFIEELFLSPYELLLLFFVESATISKGVPWI